MGVVDLCIPVAKGRRCLLSCVLIKHLYSSLTKSEFKSRAWGASVSTCLIAYCYNSGLGMSWGLQNHTKLFL